MTHPDLPAEQAYVDHAYACLAHMRAVVERAAEPALIAEGDTGLRELYGALRQPTRTPVVVHA